MGEITRIYNDEDYINSFTARRNLPEAVVQNWCAQLIRLGEETKQEKPLFADIGCGAGRFSIPLSLQLARQGSQLVCVDSSTAMLARLEKSTRNLGIKNISLVNETAEKFEHEKPIDIFFMSDIIQAVEDRTRLFRHLRSVSSATAIVAIRMSSHEQLLQAAWLSFFPAALAQDIRRTPSFEEIAKEAKEAGFEGGLSTLLIPESVEISAQEFLHPLENKAYSILRLIEEKEYQNGLASVRAFAQGKTKINTKINKTLLMIRAAPTR
jgi:trans-aconitate methyltransferase